MRCSERRRVPRRGANVRTRSRSERADQSAMEVMSSSDSLKRRGAGPNRAPILTARTILRSDLHAGSRLLSSARGTALDRDLILCGVLPGCALGLLVFSRAYPSPTELERVEASPSIAGRTLAPASSDLPCFKSQTRRSSVA